MKFIFRFFIIYILLFETSYALGEVNRDIKRVSIVSVIANPLKYNSQHIRLIGVSLFAHEGSFVCLSKEDVTYFNFVNCLEIGTLSEDLHIDEIALIETYNKKYIVIEGVFNMPEYITQTIINGDGSSKLIKSKYRGSGYIENINRIDVWQ